MPSYGLATIYEDHPVGQEFTFDNLPLHLTHIDSFETGQSVDELAVKLKEILAGQQALTTKAIADELFGINKDILVTALELTPQLTSLHGAIIRLLEREGATLKNPQFNGDNFTPHISVYGPKRVVVGQVVPIKDISLTSKVSDADDANRRVLANITLTS